MKPFLEVLFRDVVPLKGVREEPDLDVDEAEMRMLRCLAKDYDRPSSQVYEGLGFSPSAGHRIKERLRKKKYVSQVRTNLGKGGRKAVFIVPNPVVLEKFGIALGPGRGGPLHKHFQSTLKTGCEGLGYKAVIEESVGHEAPDLGLAKDEERVAVEICVTSKPKDEAENAGKAFRLGYDRVVLSFVNTQVMNKTRERATKKCSPEELERVRFCLVHRVLEEL